MKQNIPEMVKQKKEAENDAWDSVYNTSSNSNYESSNTGGTSLVEVPFMTAGAGFFIAIFIAFFKGCGLFHFDPNKGSAYLFSFKDAGEGFWILPIIGLIIGVLIIIWSAFRKVKK